MANKHYNIDEEINITINIKVKLLQCSNFTELNELQVADNVIDFKNEIADYLKSKIVNGYYREEVTLGVDDWTFDVE